MKVCIVCADIRLVSADTQDWNISIALEVKISYRDSYASLWMRPKNVLTREWKCRRHIYKFMCFHNQFFTAVLRFNGRCGGNTAGVESAVWSALIRGSPVLWRSSSSPMQEYVAYSHTGRIIPAIWFRYDLSPITVKYTERRQPLYRFITTVRQPSGSAICLAGCLSCVVLVAVVNV